jgi:BA14K-like protein
MKTTRKIATACALVLAGALAPNLALAGGSNGHHDHHGHYKPHVSFGWSHQPYGYYSAYYGAPAPWTPDWYRYCSSRYRSFNPGTGYFVGFDGHHHFCR